MGRIAKFEGKLTLILLTWKIRRAPNNASRWQMGFNSAFKGLKGSGGLNKSNKRKLFYSIEALVSPNSPSEERFA